MRYNIEIWADKISYGIKGIILNLFLAFKLWYTIIGQLSALAFKMKHDLYLVIIFVLQFCKK